MNFQELCQQSREIGDTIDITGCRRVPPGGVRRYSVEDLTLDIPRGYSEICQQVKSEHPRYLYLFAPDSVPDGSGHSLETRMGFIRELGLDGPPQVTALDIGAGSGLWSWLLQQHGHRVISTNPGGKTWLDNAYAEAHKALGLEWTPLNVQAFTTLPLEPVDVITALKTAFHSGWTANEWGFFLLDVVRCLKPGGMALLQVNHTGHAESSFVALCSMHLPDGWRRKGQDVFVYGNP